MFSAVGAILSFASSPTGRRSASRATLLAALCACVLPSACGSRSNLGESDLVPNGGSGSTGTSTGGTTATGSSGGATISTGGVGAGGAAGSGGTGGFAKACSDLKIAGPPATLTGNEWMDEQRPRWAFSKGDGLSVTLLNSRQATEGPPGADFPLSVVHTSLDPWEGFPFGGALGQSFEAFPSGGESFATTHSVEGQVSILLRDAMSPGGGMVFTSQLIPSQSGTPNVYGVHPTADEALFAAQSWVGYLTGMRVPIPKPDGSLVYSVETRLMGNAGPLAPSLPVGCASGVMYADAVPGAEGFLMAVSAGQPIGTVDCANADLSWPDVVYIVAASGGGYVQKDSFGAPGGATDVKMASRSDGAWVVAGTPPGQVVNGSFIGASINPSGKIQFTFPVTVGDPNTENPLSGTLAATNLGDCLAVTWVDYTGDKGPFLQVRTFAPDGSLAGQVQVFPKTFFSGAPALLGSPSGNSLLIAWSEEPEQLGTGAKIHAVRIDANAP
ncbi:MAG: hypothetical protein IPK82_35170 [Polyangiaceae bacterium]|nr:hypothetical protein [Polyangiaceae bacterium]